MSIATGIFLFLDLIILIVTVLPLAPTQSWWSRIGEFPRLQIAFTTLLILVVQLILLPETASFYWLMHVLLLACLVYQMLWITPYTPFFPAEVQVGRVESSADDERTISVVVANVLMSNRNAHRLSQQIGACDPDIVLLLETDGWWEEQMRHLRQTHPHGMDCPLDNRYGMHLYSRFYLENVELKFLVEEGIPSIHAGVYLRSGHCINLHALHPTPPSPTESETSRERDAELLVVGRSVSKDPRKVIVTGDFNDVAWSPTTRLFRKISRLLDPRIGRGMFSTFHAKYPLFRFPLDHVFHSDDFTLLDIQVLRPFGSDHLPIYYRLLFRPSARDEQEAPDVDADDRADATERIHETSARPSDVPNPDR